MTPFPQLNRPTDDVHSHSRARFVPAALIAFGIAVVLTNGQSASAGIVPTVNLATADTYSVLGATTVSNTNASVLGQSVGLSPGSSIVGFPPGIVLPPATIEAANATTLQAQIDLTTAYVDAANRPVEFTQTNPDLVGQTLIPGVYAATAKAPLGLSGQLVLDGQGNPNAVFVFQTDSTLITSSGSSVALVNGASECNVFWQIGSSATLGSGSVFVGNILALTSVTVESGVTVHGRALARNGAVTLDNDVFNQPSCAPSTDTLPSTTTLAPTTTTLASTTTTPGSAATTAVTDSSVAVVTTAPIVVTNIASTTTISRMPATGGSENVTAALGASAVLLGSAAVWFARRRPNVG